MLDAPIAHHFHAMGCPCELRIGGQSPQRVIERCLKEVARFESKYSRYQPDSIVSKINHNAGKAAVALDPETGSILDYAQTCFELSNGLFDITSGVLRTIWNKDTKLFPAQSSINEVLSLIGWEKVERSLEQIYLPQPGMQIDLGGVVKE
ncbi:MAG: thiamine biosynthesis lipoprotein, partial [Candidatus Azotimanducaceae bacterium]